MLFKVFEEHCHLEFHGEHCHSVAAFGGDFLHVGQGAQLVFHKHCHFKLHVVGACSRIRHYHHGLFHCHCRIFQLGHIEIRQHTG